MSLNNFGSIITDGLVFYYDQANVKKSWKGAPTTNLIVTTPLAFGVYAYASGPTTVESANETGSTITARRYSITSAVNFARARITPSLTVGQTYTFSFKIRYNGYNTLTPTFYADASKGNPEAGGANTLTNTTITQTSLGNKWYYVRHTFTVSASITGAAILAYGVTTGTDASYVNNTFDVYEEQFEVGSFATPYVNGIRSNTQALLDLVGNNVITANGLTYNSSNSFSFNGSNNYVSFPYTQANPNKFTVEAWFYNTAHSSDSNIGSILVIPYNGYNGWILSLNGPSSFLQLRHHNFNLSSTSYNVSYNTGLDLNKWYQVAAVDNSATVTLYINGKTAVSAASATSTTNSPMTCRIGAWSDTVANTSFNGFIPVVKIYNKPLSAQEISQNFNALRGRYGL